MSLISCEGIHAPFESAGTIADISIQIIPVSESIMATLYITKTTGDASVDGTLENCIEHAEAGDTVSLDPQLFVDGTFVYIDIGGREIGVNKSLTIDAGGIRTIVLTAGTGDARRFKLAGTSGNTINVVLRRVWSMGFASTSSLTGACLNANYCNLIINNCILANCSSQGNNSGLYASNAQVSISGSIIAVDAGNAINFANSAGVTAISCTCVGSVKVDVIAIDSLGVAPTAASGHFVDPARMNFRVKPDSIYYSGRTYTEGDDVNGNAFVLDGPYGATATAPDFDHVNATYDDGVIHFEGGSTDHNMQVNDDATPIAYSCAGSVPTTRTEAGFHLYEACQDEWVEFTVSVQIDEDWLKAFCLAIETPVSSVAEARAIFGDAIEKWRQR